MKLGLVLLLTTSCFIQRELKEHGHLQTIPNAAVRRQSIRVVYFHMCVSARRYEFWWFIVGLNRKHKQAPKFSQISPNVSDIGATMNQNIALALNHFIDMSKVDQQDYLNVLTDYVYARRSERVVTTETMRNAIAASKFIPQVEIADQITAG